MLVTPTVDGPVLYSATLAADALAVLATGWLCDRFGARVPAVLPGRRREPA
ncbi:hypothetical protein [Streptomyces sp. NPDC096142]|uniref:hypothetical protein n=1 Tax=Streptomyces sp. NPDC096142 TaxID=3366077 RepID=UPI0038204CE3